MSDPPDELADADVISGGGEDFGAFAASRWPELVRIAYELTGDESAATDLAQAALARTSPGLVAGQPDRRPGRLRAARPDRGGYPGRRRGQEGSGAGSNRCRRSASIRSSSGPEQSARGGPGSSPSPCWPGLVAATAWLVAAFSPRRPARFPGSADRGHEYDGRSRCRCVRGRHRRRRSWQLTVQDIADPGYRCLPGVSINGNDADPLFADPHPLRQSPVGDPAFVMLGSELPGRRVRGSSRFPRMPTGSGPIRWAASSSGWRRSR